MPPYQQLQRTNAVCLKLFRFRRTKNQPYRLASPGCVVRQVLPQGLGVKFWGRCILRKVGILKLFKSLSGRSQKGPVNGRSMAFRPAWMGWSI